MAVLDARTLVELLRAADHAHRTISNNLANLNTPGYRTARVEFAQELDRLLDEDGRLSDGKQIATRVYRPLFADATGDGNDVTLEREIVELNKNMLRMRLYLGVLGARIRRLRAAIEGK